MHSATQTVKSVVVYWNTEESRREKKGKKKKKKKKQGKNTFLFSKFCVYSVYINATNFVFDM
eukprot:m.203789 g.203789  ORF g.203789 m.203789 type:complete len:62 (-) comp16879_c5_seq1:40-225(-)